MPQSETVLPVLDLQPLALLFGTFGPDCVEMLVLFGETTRRLLEDVVAAVAAGEWPAAQQAAHSAKGACNMTGACRLGALFAGVEQAVQRNDGDTARSLAKVLPAAFAAVEEAIAAVLSGKFAEGGWPAVIGG